MCVWAVTPSVLPWRRQRRPCCARVASAQSASVIDGEAGEGVRPGQPLATVHRDGLTGQVVAGIREREDGQVGQLVDGSGATERNLIRLGGADRTLVGRIEHLPCVLGRNGAGCKRIHPDAVSPPLHRQRHRHRVDRRLGHCRRDHECRPVHTHVVRFDSTDAGQACGDPALAHGNRGVEGPGHHRRRHRFEGALAEAGGRGDEVRGGVVEQPGERPVPLPDLANRRVDRRRIPHVDGLIVRRTGPAVGDLFGSLGQHRFAPTPQVHFGPMLDQPGSHPAAKTGSAAGDQDPLTRQQIGCEDLTLRCAHGPNSFSSTRGRSSCR